MSRHRVKNISYDDDDLEDEVDDNEDELSPEDREQMRVRTLEVQQLLQTQIPPIEAKEDDIWEALWHYFYDVDKSVDYLTSMHFFSFDIGHERRIQYADSYLIEKYRAQEKKGTKTRTPTAATKKKNTAGEFLFFLPILRFALPLHADAWEVMRFTSFLDMGAAPNLRMANVKFSITSLNSLFGA
ncbi:hypothetical protein McaMca56_003473 [Microsporum canis]